MSTETRYLKSKGTMKPEPSWRLGKRSVRMDARKHLANTVVDTWNKLSEEDVNANLVGNLGVWVTLMRV